MSTPDQHHDPELLLADSHGKTLRVPLHPMEPNDPEGDTYDLGRIVRLASSMRKATGQATARIGLYLPPRREIYSFADNRIEVDATKEVACADKRPLALPATAFSVLTRLARSAGGIVPNETIKTHLRQGQDSPDSAVSTQISIIRQELGPVLNGSIVTYVGIGYMALETLDLKA